MAILTRLDKRKAVFVKIIATVPTIVGSKRIKVRAGTVEQAQVVKFKKIAYPINLGKPSYRRKNWFMYIIDIDSGQMTYYPNQMPVTKALMDSVFISKTAQMLFSAVKKSGFSTDAIILCIMGLGMGIAIGYILGLFLTPGTSAPEPTQTGTFIRLVLNALGV